MIEKIKIKSNVIHSNNKMPPKLAGLVSNILKYVEKTEQAIDRKGR